MAGNEVRIIGGIWKGRKLRFPAIADLRPTLGRARGSLFNWLAGEIHGARCLDLFAGSGALGFEALSRGAAHVAFVERNRNAAQAIRDNIAQLEAANAEVFAIPAQRFLRRQGPAWDIIFLDPPFTSKDFAQTLELIQQLGLLQPDGRVYFDRPCRQSLPASPHWLVAKANHAGDTQFGLLRLTQPQTPDQNLSV
jgi:16S rRNA (guanine966-N2)-methyltransferase